MLGKDGRQTRRFRFQIVGLGILALALARPAFAKVVEGHVLYVTLDEIYLDIGTGVGLQKGDVGDLSRDGKVVARAVVDESSRNSSRVRLVSQVSTDTVQAGDLAQFSPSYQEWEVQPSTAVLAGPMQTPAAEKPFVPLLAPYSSPTNVITRAENISHGMIRFHQTNQYDTTQQSNYAMSRLETSGSFDRINGSSWAFVWDGDLSYRNGAAFQNSPDYQNVRNDIFRLILQKQFQNHDFLRLGRFITNELPGLGTINGGQYDGALNKNWRMGAVAGFRPGPTPQTLTTNQPMTSLYGTFEGGQHQSFYCSETAGLMGAMFDGKFDQLAFLHDQRMDLGPTVNLYSNLQVDFNVNGSTLQSHVLLTRLNASANWTATPIFSFRGGVDHSQRPVTQAELAAFNGEPSYFVDPGYWRYWGGTSQNLPGQFRLDEEVGVVTDNTGRTPTQWQFGVAHTGLPFVPTGSINFSVYNLMGAGMDGEAGSLSAQIPLFDNRFYFSPSCRMRYYTWTSQNAPSGKKFQFTDYTLRGDWRPTRRFGVFAGLTQTFTDVANTLLIDAGVDTRW